MIKGKNLKKRIVVARGRKKWKKGDADKMTRARKLWNFAIGRKKCGG
jgi:hypothetical protein